MNTVVKLNPPASAVEDIATVDFDQSDIQRAALQVFEEMADGGCSLRDCITAVYLAGMEKITGAKPVKRAKKPAVPPCPYKAIGDAYNEILCPPLARVRFMEDPKRKKVMRDFWRWIFESRKESGERRATTAEQGVAWVRLYFTRAVNSAFLMGKAKRSPGYEEWMPDMDYMVSLRGMKQVIEKTESES